MSFFREQLRVEIATPTEKDILIIRNPVGDIPTKIKLTDNWQKTRRISAIRWGDNIDKIVGQTTKDQDWWRTKRNHELTMIAYNMRAVRLCTLFLVFIYLIYAVLSDAQRGLEVIPERAEITYSNDKYVTNNSVNVRRYSRKGGYVVNFWGIIKHTWANNVTIDIIMYEYLHNEYKRSFVEFHFKLCDLVNKDEFIGESLRRRGIKCPMEKGYNGITNATMTLPKFPYVFPFQRCRAEVIFKTEPSHEMIGKGHLYLIIKQVPLNKVKMNN